MNGIWERLWAIGADCIYHVTVNTNWQGNLYLTCPGRARRLLRALFKSNPYTYTVARSPQGMVHIHVTAVLESPPTSGYLSQYDVTLFVKKVTSIEHLWNLAEYFSRPHDERAARPKRWDKSNYWRHRQYAGDARKSELYDAAELYLRTKEVSGRRRYAPLRGTRNVPRKVYGVRACLRIKELRQYTTAIQTRPQRAQWHVTPWHWTLMYIAPQIAPCLRLIPRAPPIPRLT